MFRCWSPHLQYLTQPHITHPTTRPTPHSRKFKKLDTLFANDVVGNSNSNVVGPVEAAQGRFYRGQVIPIIVAGWFGESGEDFEKVIHNC